MEGNIKLLKLMGGQRLPQCASEPFHNLRCDRGQIFGAKLGEHYPYNRMLSVPAGHIRFPRDWRQGGQDKIRQSLVLRFVGVPGNSNSIRKNVLRDRIARLRSSEIIRWKADSARVP